MLKRRVLLAPVWFILASPVFAEDSAPTPTTPAPISYYKQIRPIFQAHCQGCHQPAKSSGEYVMTSFASLLHGGESGTAAIVAGKPDDSYLVQLITPADGRAEMPQGKPPLAASDIEQIRSWIEQGATDDTPANARRGMTKTTCRSTRGRPWWVRWTFRRTASSWLWPVSTKCCCSTRTVPSALRDWLVLRSGLSRCDSRRTEHDWPSRADCRAGWAKCKSGR